MNYEILSVSTLEEIEKLRKKYDKALELLSNYDLPCKSYNFVNSNIRFCHGIHGNCGTDSEIHKYCWDKYIESKIKEIRKL